MSNRDNSPELDYLELRRRHQEYKSRQRTPQPPDAAPPKAPAPEEVLHTDDIQDAPADIPAVPADEPATTVPQAPTSAPDDAFADLLLADDAESDDLPDDEDALQDANPNPFDSFIRFFHGVKDNISARQEAREEAEIDALDGDDLDDEELAQLEEDEDAKPRWRHKSRQPDYEDEDEEFVDEGAEDFEDEDEDVSQESNLKRFINLFVTRVDDEPHQRKHREEFPVNYMVNDYDDATASEQGSQSDIEGGLIMDEMNKPVSEPVSQMAEESSGMTRRERRELAMRKAAEEAAHKAAEETAKAAAETKPSPIAPEPISSNIPTIEPLFAEETPETVEEPSVPVADEPTREFTPVSMRNAEDSADEEDLFEVDDEEEDEEVPHKGFFGRRRTSKHSDEDEDDEEDDDDEDDEDEENERSAPRRGLFNRHKKVEDDEDDEDEEDYDDEDDEDDDYDDYDEDEDYDDEEHRPFGYHVVGVLKWVLRIIFVLLVFVLVLNFLYVTGTDTIVPKMHDAMGDTSAFHLLFFGYDIRQVHEPEATPTPEVDPYAVEPEGDDALLSLDGYGEEETEPTMEPEVTFEIPDLGSEDSEEPPIVPTSDEGATSTIG